MFIYNIISILVYIMCQKFIFQFLYLSNRTMELYNVINECLLLKRELTQDDVHYSLIEMKR